MRASSGRLLTAAALVFLAVLVIHLTPLPLGWFTAQAPAPLLDGIVPNPVWRTLSVTPAASWAAAVSAIPIFAVFAGVSQLDASARMKLVWLVIGLSAVNLLLGFLQMAQGPQSPLRFYEITNPSEAVGLFANRNHFAAALYTGLVFASVWLAVAAGGFGQSKTLNSRALLWLAAAAAFLLAMIGGLAASRSRAGLLLAMVAMGGIVAMFFLNREAPGRHGGKQGDAQRSVRKMVVVTLGVAIVFAAQFGLHRTMSRFETDSYDSLRAALTPMTVKLAIQNLPFGTGLGSFVPVYAGAERTADMSDVYANRAHNDWAEFLLETGAGGIVIMALFLTWFAIRARAVWTRLPAGDAAHDLLLQRGATVAIALLMAHSLVDYPLRTTSMSVLFALACALLIEAPERAAPVAASPQRIRQRKPAARVEPPRRSGVPAAPASDDWAAAWEKAEARKKLRKDDPDPL